jgi:hypothetical protein
MIARQPFTFGGVARFAHASFFRLAMVALIFGLVSGIVVSWLAATCFAPVIDEAISNLPLTGSIERGTLHWPEKDGRLLGANAFASFSVAINERQSEGAPVDFTFEFRTNAFVARSFPGTTALPYPSHSEIELNRTALFPAWGAWRAPILAGLIPATAVVLCLTWALLGVVYGLVPFLLAVMLGRDLTLRADASRRMETERCSAASGFVDDGFRVSALFHWENFSDPGVCDAARTSDSHALLFNNQPILRSQSRQILGEE